MSLAPWSAAPETVRPADVIDHRALGYYYDTIDPECRLKLKFVDDIIKQPWHDPIKFKFRDDPIKLKIWDDPIKQWLDPIGGPGPGDPATLAAMQQLGGLSPFVLATPHHAPGLGEPTAGQ
jgi:hypothetical protein